MNFIRIIMLPLVTSAIVSAAPISSVYTQKCGNCHGVQGEKIAMGKSKAIKGMSPAKVEKALYEYASGTKPALPMVRIMKKNFVDTSSKEQIRALAEYISTL